MSREKTRPLGSWEFFHRRAYRFSCRRRRLASTPTSTSKFTAPELGNAYPMVADREFELVCGTLLPSWKYPNVFPVVVSGANAAVKNKELPPGLAPVESVNT